MQPLASAPNSAPLLVPTPTLTLGSQDRQQQGNSRSLIKGSFQFPPRRDIPTSLPARPATPADPHIPPSIYSHSTHVPRRVVVFFFNTCDPIPHRLWSPEGFDCKVPGIAITTHLGPGQRDIESTRNKGDVHLTSSPGIPPPLLRGAVCMS
jgi:hypothetical protein